MKTADHSPGVQLVWFKRDLRVHDHRPLIEAARRGPVICLYVYEPEALGAATYDPAHLCFTNESLVELDLALRSRGGRMVYRVGRMPEVLQELSRTVAIERIWAHEETGTLSSYRRDRRVRRWARTNGIEMTELPQFGVIRPLRDRDGWAARWAERMRGEPDEPPRRVRTVDAVAPQAVRSLAELGLEESTRDLAQTGGESRASALLDGFLAERGVDYRRAMSSPLSAWDGCSRLSAHLAHGTISMRTVHAAVRARRAEVKRLKADGAAVDSRWLQSLSSFSSRLRWHCHFMQKLEDQPSLERENMSRAFDGLRDEHPDLERLEAWCAGRTGYPMVDACMRALHRSGWINFRMRAMLVSFASYHLWLDWRATSSRLGRLFVDFEPGIHYPQFQMQSGVTGINAIRIYSPTKQALDQDPDGTFIRRFVPELEGVPDHAIHRPWTMTLDEQRAAGCRIGREYPGPIVDHAEAVREAKRRIWEVKRREQTKREARAVYERHGSRRRPPERAGRRRRAASRKT